MTDTPQPSASPTMAAPADKQEAGLVAFADCELIDISDAMTLVINRQNGNQQVISPQVVEGLTTCTEFKTIEAHVAHLATTRPELNSMLPEKCFSAASCLYRVGSKSSVNPAYTWFRNGWLEYCADYFDSFSMQKPEVQAAGQAAGFTITMEDILRYRPDLAPQ